MAGALVGGAALGLAFTVVYESGKYMYKVYKSSDLKELEETLNGLLPILNEIREVSLESSSNVWVPKIQEFQNKLQEEENIKTSRNPFKKANHKNKVKGEISKMSQNVLVPTMALNQIKLMNSSQEMNDFFSTQMKTLCGLIQNLTLEQRMRFNNVTTKIDELQADFDFAGLMRDNSQQDRELCPLPDMPLCLMGFESHVMELKKFVLEDGVDVVGVTAIGGAGKSALVTALCHHPQIQEHFKDRVAYIVVSESPDLLNILKTMWRNIVGGAAPNFRNVEDAHNKLQFKIKTQSNEPIMVVLDDIWEFSDLKEVLFKGEQYRTIVTTRDKKIIQCIPSWFNKGHYPLPSLQDEHALSLFCLCAFDMCTIPDTHNQLLVKQVQAECKGLPLALQVIGSSLNGEPDCVWEATRDLLARGKASDDNQIKVLLKRLETSINVPSLGEKQCFLDLAVFPKGRMIPANILLDIWVYVRQMKKSDAVLLLWKFAARNLLDLKRDPWTPESTDDCMSSYSFYQHDVMRQLALFLAEQDNQTRFRRLYMPQKQSELPSEWQTEGNHSSRAQIVSIHTGAMKDTEWPIMELPEAEAMVLYFSASEYCIPTFLDTMTKLKVLIVHNNNAKRAKLSGLVRFQELSQLKTLHLERLIVPPLHEDCKALKGLQKISLSLCEGLCKDKMFNLPSLLEFNVDHCSDLEELSAGICCSNYLETLSITHCHRLTKLPDDLGKLGSLKVIRLCESPGLKALPNSICRFPRLELLNISACMGLKVYKNESPELKKILQSVGQLTSLTKVICDEDNKHLFKSNFRPHLKVEAVVEEFNLNWLFWGTD